MVDQERMKAYIEMGFEKDAAYKMCVQEDKDAQKAAAKENKQIEEKEPEEKPDNDFNKDEFKEELMQSINETVKDQVNNAFKENKLQEIIKGSENNQAAKTTLEKLTDSVKSYYGYK